MRTARKANAPTPALDLDVLREVVLYAIGDTARAPHLASVDLALRRVIEEIDAVVPPGPPAASRSFSFGRFIPRTARPATNTAPLEPASRAQLDGHGDDARPAIVPRRTRTGFGDRAFLQQSITDYFRRPGT